MLKPGLPSRFIYIALTALIAAACGNDGDFEVSGLLEWDRIELIAEAGEPVIDLMAREGERLATGQPILQLDPHRTQAQHDEAAAALAQYSARLAELKRGPRAELIDEAQAHLQGAKSALETRQTEYERVQALVTRNLVSDEALDLARSARDTAKAERDAAQANLAAMLTGTTVEELQQATAIMQQAEARLRAISITLDRLTVKAPRDGLLDTLPYKFGEHPRTGDVVAVMLAGQQPYARVYIPEPRRARLNHETKATIQVDGIQEPFTGKVRMVSSDATFTPFYSLTQRDRSRLSYVAEIELQGEQAATLTSGIPLKVQFHISEPETE
jgi:HlyD family secretion protein